MQIFHNDQIHLVRRKEHPDDGKIFLKHGLSQPAVFWTTFIDFRRPLEKDGFWAAVYYIDGYWTAF